MVETLEGIAAHIGVALMRKRMTAALKDSLSEKDVLLKEVHHRVKNNLAAIMGLVDMQGKDLADDAAGTALEELSTRIKSMALVHEQLYQSGNLARVNFQGYLETLVAHLRWAYEKSGGIQVSIAAEGVTMGLDYAVPCGLLITELVTNTFKYAFPDGQARPGATSCQLAVAVSWDGAAYSLTVADNGVGLPAGLGWATTKTLGLTLVGMLGQHQLQGTIDLDLSGGTMFRLRFAPKSK
jgi:two-component sensor histidine kinase